MGRGPRGLRVRPTTSRVTIAPLPSSSSSRSRNSHRRSCASSTNIRSRFCRPGREMMQLVDFWRSRHRALRRLKKPYTRRTSGPTTAAIRCGWVRLPMSPTHNSLRPRKLSSAKRHKHAFCDRIYCRLDIPPDEDGDMIFGKFVTVIKAFFNSIANALWERDPIAIMRLEYDRSVEQLQEGRKGLELYRGLVERVVRQTTMGKSQVEKMKAEVKAYLKAGDRETAGKFALQLQKAEADLAQNQEQLKMHEEAYENNLKKIQYANKQLAEVREKIERYNADLKMTAAEAEIARIAGDLNFDVTTDFGQIEQIIHTNRGKVRVAADLSSRGVADIKARERVESQLAEDVLQQYEVELGLKSPETTPVVEGNKNLGPATDKNS